MGRKENRKPDVILKNYWSSNERFADLFNAVLFQGKIMIHPEELEEEDTEVSTVMEHREYAETIQASRDMIKIQKKSSVSGVRLVLLGMENQEHVHYAMPLRVMGYDYAAYKKQYNHNAGRYRVTKGLKEDEYLSRMRKSDRFIPVITVVMYYGEREWDGAKSLHEMLNIPKGMKRFVNDYKMLLVEASCSNLVFHNVNNKNLFCLLKIMLDQNSSSKVIRNKAIEYSREHKVEKDVILTAASAANCKLDAGVLEEKGEGTMYRVFEETREEGKIEGKAEEIVEMGMEFGLSVSDILERLQNKLDISQQKASEYIEMFGK